MKEEIKLLFALRHIESISKLIDDNEYQQFMFSHLVPIQVELSRQLTNLTKSSKIME